MKDNWHWFIFGVICSGVVVFALCVLFLPPKTVYVERPVEVVREVIKEVPIDRVVYQNIPQTVIVDKIVYQYILFKEWESIEQFTEWYKAQNFTDILLLSDGNEADCDDYALWVASEALKQGYLVSCQLTDCNGWIMGKRVNAGLHMGNLVIIGNDLWWVEPNPEMFHVMKLGVRD